jgi:hypothetical protein
MSSAILYLAIVAIWAFLLVPRWVRRGHVASFAGGSAGSESSGVAEVESPAGAGLANRASGDDAEPGGDYDADDADTAPMPAVVIPPEAPVGSARSGDSGGSSASGAGGSEDDAEGRTRSLRTSGPARPVISRGKAMQARRRLLTILVLLGGAAASCTVLRLTSPWVCVPPAVMLGMYVLLLRETAMADSERGERRAAVAAAERREALARSRAAWAARTPQPVTVTVPASPSAQIIDISGRLRDQLYDQYEDAAIRAVGD